MSTQDLECLSVEKCVQRTGISRSSLYPHITSGDLPSILIGRRRLVRAETLREWLKSKEQNTVAKHDRG